MARQRNFSDFLQFYAFPSQLGWVVTTGRDGKLVQLAFGFSSQREAEQSVVESWSAQANVKLQNDPWHPELAARIMDYGHGAAVEFDDIEIDDHDWTPFRRQVLQHCRQIPYGGYLSYRELADRVGCAGGARAVGNALANNPVPLVIPCHRVLTSKGRLGGYSAVGGVSMKERLLQREGAWPIAANAVHVKSRADVLTELGEDQRIAPFSRSTRSFSVS